MSIIIKASNGQDTWVSQSVKCLTLDFGSGHDLAVGEFKPCVGLCADSKSLLEILSLPLSAHPPLVLTPSK